MVIRKKPNSPTQQQLTVKAQPGYLANEIRKARSQQQQDFSSYIERKAITVQQFIDEMLSRAKLEDVVVMESDWLRPIFFVREYSRVDGRAGHAVCILDGSPNDDAEH